jgi:[protein-PII] uridylyltransferase
VPAKVSADSRASQSFTVIDVRAEDRPGLLYDIAHAIHEAGAQIAIAKIATEAHHAIDSFYVTRGGAPLAASAELEALTAAIERAISSPPRPP